MKNTLQTLHAIAFITVLCWGISLVGGCSTRYAQIEKPDGTVIIIELSEIMADKKAEDIKITVDKATGAYTFTVKGYSSETSPIVSSVLKAVYEAGMKAGGI